MPTPESGTLFLVPTPIGNLEDITLRALRVLRQVDWVAAEDTRRARVLFQAYDLHAPLLSHHAHNEHRETPKLVARLLRGERGALITDAGTPGISDPGFLLARAARAAGVRVEALPGASAVTTALLASGFPPEPFVFLGYLAATPSRRRQALREIAVEPRTTVVFETPHRVRRTLSEAAEAMPERPVALLRELTKLHEEVRVGTPAELAESLPPSPRGEIVLVFSPLPRAVRRSGAREAGSARRASLPRGGEAS